MTTPSPSTVGDAALGALRARLACAVYAPGDPGYDAARSGFGLTNTPSPDAVVMPDSAADVQTAVRVARAVGLPVAVHGTGHNFAYAYPGGLLLNTSRMRGVRFDDAAGTVHVEPGVRWRDVLPGAHARGLAGLAGSSPDVGVVGYALHGGVGWLARAYGSAAGSIRSAMLVTADGALVRAARDENPDLFWALRGGGGNFGVVVDLELALVPVGFVYGGSVLYPLARAREVLTAYRSWVTTLPDAMTSSVTLLRVPPLPHVPEGLRGRAVVVVRACFAGPEDEGVRWLEPVRTLGGPLADAFRTLPYDASGEISQDPTEPAASWRATMDLAGLGDDVVDALLCEAGGEAPYPLSVVEIRHLGGALARGEHDYAFGARRAPFTLQTIGMRDGPHGGAAVAAATASLVAALRPFGAGSLLPGWLGDGDGGTERLRAGYDAGAWARLLELKRTWDPTNLFRLNHNIRPQEPATS